MNQQRNWQHALEARLSRRDALRVAACCGRTSTTGTSNPKPSKSPFEAEVRVNRSVWLEAKCV